MPPPTQTSLPELKQLRDLEERRGLHQDLTFNRPSTKGLGGGLWRLRTLFGGYVNAQSNNSVVYYDFGILVLELTRTGTEINPTFNFAIKLCLNVV